MSLLSSAAPKRESKGYLSRFKTTAPHATGSVSAANPNVPKQEPYDAKYVNQESNPKIDLQTVKPLLSTEISPEQLHIALIKFTEPELTDDRTLRGIGQTLSLLTALDMSCCVVVEPGPLPSQQDRRKEAIRQANRLASAIASDPSSFSTTCADSIIEVCSSSTTANPLANDFPGPHLSITTPNRLLWPLLRKKIVFVPSVGHQVDTQRNVPVDAHQLVATLARELKSNKSLPNSPNDSTGKEQKVSLDRLIILDPVGGIPRGQTNGHLFVNLKQEYDDIVEDLSSKANLTSEPSQTDNDSEESPMSTYHRHFKNLHLLRSVLADLPQSSSGIILTPDDAHSLNYSAHRNTAPTPSVATRRQRNLLVHNLLTDRPMYSPSLPTSRWRKPYTKDRTYPIHSTFVKKGMPVTIFPDPRISPWSPEGALASPLHLDSDPRIDLPRLVHLIENSFGRKLDVESYLRRIGPQLAGVIIAGEYEGGAILTWEAPPGQSDPRSNTSLTPSQGHEPERLVPYLDKFAVLKEAQGTNGVADVVFNAMVRQCLPGGVCWRSRADNPVNKWYFDRARGSWKLHDTQWTMFWTTYGLIENLARFVDYENVCKSIKPSWKD